MPALTRSPAQKSACKGLERDGQRPAIMSESAYTPTSNRAGSTLTFFNALPQRRGLRVRTSAAMAKDRPSRPRPLTLRLLTAPDPRLLSLTRSPTQKSACKDLSRNGQRPAITSEAAYTPTSNRAGSTLIFLTRSPAQKSDPRLLSLTRSPAQKSACKDLGRNGQNRAITPKATYTPTSNRAGSTLT